MSTFLFSPGSRGNMGDRMRMLEDSSNATRLNKCAGSTGRFGSGGSSIFTPRNRLAAVAGHPYKGYYASTGGMAGVVIQIGSHGGVVPSLNGGPLLSATLAANFISLDSSDLIVYVDLNVQSGSISGATIYVDDSMTPPADTVSGGTGDAYQVLFYVAVYPTGVEVSDNVQGSQAYQNCNDVALYGLI